jgi:hypothetical protein
MWGNKFNVDNYMVYWKNRLTIKNGHDLQKIGVKPTVSNE